jgi:4-hydroxybenzoate polyprenyltransferase
MLIEGQQNDYLDAPYDRQVARCRLRPIARFAVADYAALAFIAAQTVLGVTSTLVPLPAAAREPAALLTGTQIFYPFFKRFTNYPQLWLGLSLALGFLVGAGSGGFDLHLGFGDIFSQLYKNYKFPQRGETIELENRGILFAFICLFAATLVNTLVYDTIYGHQDLADDLKAGVKSVAIAWREKTKRNCTLLAVVEVSLLLTASRLGGLGRGFDVLAVGGTGLVLATVLWCVRLSDPTSCMWGFKWLIWGTGVALTLGLFSTCIQTRKVWPELAR